MYSEFISESLANLGLSVHALDGMEIIYGRAPRTALPLFLANVV